MIGVNLNVWGVWREIVPGFLIMVDRTFFSHDLDLERKKNSQQQEWQRQVTNEPALIPYRNYSFNLWCVFHICNVQWFGYIWGRRLRKNKKNIPLKTRNKTRSKTWNKTRNKTFLKSRNKTFLKSRNSLFSTVLVTFC